MAGNEPGSSVRLWKTTAARTPAAATSGSRTRTSCGALMSTADSAAVTPAEFELQLDQGARQQRGRQQPGRQRTACGGGRREWLGGGRRGLLAAQDAEHAPDVGERLAGAGGDGGKRLPRGGTVALLEQARHVAGLAGDRREASGGGRLEVGGDPHPLLLGGRGRIAAARPLKPRGLVRELSPEQS